MQMARLNIMLNYIKGFTKVIFRDIAGLIYLNLPYNSFFGANPLLMHSSFRKDYGELESLRIT